MSSSVKLNVVAATGVDSCFGDEAAKNMSACIPTSIITGGSGCMLTIVGLLIVKRGSKPYQKVKL